ncbi:MAG: AMP-binding protein, partial [Candidatus Dormiibacterota bacterium]
MEIMTRGHDRGQSRSAHVDTFTRRHLPPDGTWPELVFPLPELRYPERLNAAQRLLDHWVERGDGDRTCVIGERESLTYAQLQARADQIANVLVRDLGLQPGNRVLLRSPNNPWAAACWFAVLKAGGVVVTTMPLLRRAEIATILEIAECSLALCGALLVALAWRVDRHWTDIHMTAHYCAESPRDLARGAVLRWTG